MEEKKPKLGIVGDEPETEPANEAGAYTPFDDLDALRNAQDYDEFLSSEGSSAFNIRTLKDSIHLRVNPDRNYSLLGHYVVNTKQGAYFVDPEIPGRVGADATTVQPTPRR